MQDDVVEAIVAKMREVPRDGGFVDLADLARAILPIARKHFMEEAAGIAIAEAHRNRKNAEQYPATEDGGDGSREQCLVAAIACFDVVTAIRASGEPK